MVLSPREAVALYGSDGSEGDELQGLTQVKASDAQQVAVVVRGASAEVILDSLTLRGGLRGLDCEASGASLRLWWLRGTIQEAAAVGLRSAGCEVRMVGGLLQDNGDGALEVRGGSYLIQRSRFWRDRSVAEAAVRLRDDALPLQRERVGGRDDAFQDNCVVGNRNNQQWAAAGVDCGTAGRMPQRLLRGGLLCDNGLLDASRACAVLMQGSCQGVLNCPALP